VSFRELKAQIYWPTTDQKVRGSNPCGRTYKLMYNCNMLKKVLLPTLLLAVFLSGCSNSSDPAQTNEDAKKCEAIVKLFNERLLLEGKAEKIQGWQLILDNPTCFLSDAVEIAKTEISALQNQP
jgi:hypothetical protein